MRWIELEDTVDKWVTKLATPASTVRKVAADLITSTHFGYYCSPDDGRVGLYAPGAKASDLARVKLALDRAGFAGPTVPFLSYQDLSNPDGQWVKVAYSPTLRRAGELLNFFPGQYTGNVPNAPSPAAAMLTSGLVGAGLGWGAGRLVGGVLPDGYGKKLSRSGLILGALLGAAPGAVWGATNKLTGREFNDPSLLHHGRGDAPVDYPSAINGTNADNLSESGVTPAEQLISDTAQRLREAPLPKIKIGTDLSEVVLSDCYKIACEKVAETFGYREEDFGAHPADVNIDALGRTLWETGASPNLAATTMASMYAARQLPDNRSRPGFVTGHQLGQLASNAVGDYARGYLVGAVINTAIGTPFRNSTFGAGNAALGLIGAVVPKLFGE